MQGAGSDSDFSFEIKLPPMSELDQKSLRVVATKVSIPKSYDNVVSGRNTFTLTETKLAVTSSASITVTVGTYDVNNFRTTLQSLLNAATMNAFVYTVAWNSLTGRYTISSTGTSSITTPAAVGFGIHSLLGTVAGATNALPFVSPNKVFFQLTSAVQLRSDIVSANDNVLAPVYAAETPYNTSIVYIASDLDVLAKPLSANGNGVYRFYVTDIDGQPLELNGGTVAFELCVYTPLEMVMREYMQMRTLQALQQVAEPSDEEVKRLAEQVRLQRLAAAAAGVDVKTDAAPPPAAVPATAVAAEMATPDASAQVVGDPKIIERYTDEQDRTPGVIPETDADLVIVNKPADPAPAPAAE